VGAGAATRALFYLSNGAEVNERMQEVLRNRGQEDRSS
jgi:hypothetical protein